MNSGGCGFVFSPGALQLSRSRSSCGKNPPALARGCSPSTARRRAPAFGMAPSHRRNNLPVAKVLTLLAACLGAVFVASIVLEAFDGDLALWPFGGEDFTVTPHADLLIGSQPCSTLLTLSALQSFVMTAGAHLVLGHRARSALATDSPTPFARVHHGRALGAGSESHPGARPFLLVW